VVLLFWLKFAEVQRNIRRHVKSRKLPKGMSHNSKDWCKIKTGPLNQSNAQQSATLDDSFRRRLIDFAVAAVQHGAKWHPYIGLLRCEASLDRGTKT